MAMNQGNAPLEYQDIEPPFDWDHEKESDTLIVALPGFKKEQLRVQVTSTRKLRLSGERKIGDTKIRKFYKELPIPSDTDTSSISAKFESGVLYVKLPKLITTPIPQPPPPASAPTPPTVRPQQQPQPQPKPEPPIAHSQDEQKQGVMDKAPAPAPAPETPPTLPEKKEKGKEEENKNNNDDNAARKVGKDDDDEKKRGVIEEGASSRVKEMEGRELGLGLGKRLSTVSRQGEEYRNAVYGLVEEMKKQKKMANLVVVMVLVVLLVLYVNNAIKSSFGGGGPKIQEL